MSFQAMAWAVAQKTGSPARKALLLAIANYADELGVCWPSRERLAADSEQSIDSVDRHMKELESAGFIMRTRRQVRHDGGEQSKLITLLFDQTRMQRDLTSNRTPKTVDQSRYPVGQNTSYTPAANCGSPPAAEDIPPPPQIAAPPAADCGPNLSREPIKDSSPLPPEGELGGGFSIEQEGKGSSGFHQFRSAWPKDPTINWERVKAVFISLPEADQIAASDTAQRYVSYCEKIGRRLKAPQNWLREQGWSGFLEQQNDTAPDLGERPKPMIWIREGTEAWLAWKTYCEKTGKRPRSPINTRHEQGLGFYFPSEFPPEEVPS